MKSAMLGKGCWGRQSCEESNSPSGCSRVALMVVSSRHRRAAGRSNEWTKSDSAADLHSWQQSDDLSSRPGREWGRPVLRSVGR